MLRGYTVDSKPNQTATTPALADATNNNVVFYADQNIDFDLPQKLE